jgi:hypothetical protein
MHPDRPLAGRSIGLRDVVDEYDQVAFRSSSNFTLMIEDACEEF